MNNKLIVGKELNKLNSDLSTHIEIFTKSIREKRYSVIVDGGLYSLGWLDAFRLFLEQYKDNNSPQKKMIVNSLHHLNKTCPWSIPLYFKEFLGEKTQLGSARRISSTELNAGLSKVSDEFIASNASVLYDAVLQSGSVGSLTLKHHEDPYSQVETFLGFKTLVNLNHFFHGHVKSGQIKDCKIIVVNGAIIEVSEIHHILEHAYNTKEAVILIASSFSDDVSNTLHVNWESGKIRVIPFLLPDSIETINESKDICSILGITPVSSDNGLRVNNISMEDYPKFDVYYNRDNDSLRILLDQEGSKRAQRSKLLLQKKYDEEKVGDVKSILSDRISRMSARNTIVYTRLSDTSKGLIEDRAGAFFSYFSRCAKQNVVEMNADYFVKYLPASDALTAINMAKSDRRSLDNIKAILRLDHEAC